MFRVIIAGGRDFQDYSLLEQTMDRLLMNIRKHEQVSVLSGKAQGTDTLGERYAQERGLLLCPFPADWERFGRAAGFVRNEEMAANADALVAFWDGNSRGTKHMIDTAERRHLKVRVIRYCNADVSAMRNGYSPDFTSMRTMP